MIVYTILPYDEWLAFKATGVFPREGYGFWDRQVDAWLKDHLAERTGLESGDVRDTYVWLSRPPNHWMWLPKRAVLKIRVAEEHVVPFDDDGYVHMLNTVGNGMEEGDEARMFDVSGSSSDTLRAFVATPITFQMVRKAWCYRWGSRLRRRRPA